MPVKAAEWEWTYGNRDRECLQPHLHPALLHEAAAACLSNFEVAVHSTAVLSSLFPLPRLLHKSLHASVG